MKLMWLVLPDDGCDNRTESELLDHYNIRHAVKFFYIATPKCNCPRRIKPKEINGETVDSFGNARAALPDNPTESEFGPGLRPLI
jgi:hypothetical protein